MDKIDRLIMKADSIPKVMACQDYDYSRLTTDELRELLNDDTTEARILEILEGSHG